MWKQLVPVETNNAIHTVKNSEYAVKPLVSIELKQVGIGTLSSQEYVFCPDWAKKQLANRSAIRLWRSSVNFLQPFSKCCKDSFQQSPNRGIFAFLCMISNWFLPVCIAWLAVLSIDFTTESWIKSITSRTSIFDTWCNVSEGKILFGLLRLNVSSWSLKERTSDFSWIDCWTFENFFRNQFRNVFKNDWN